MLSLEGRVEADLGCGRHREVLGELEALTVEFPLRERLWGLWMLALCRAGRQAEALAAYQLVRRVLGEQLGIEPSTELRMLEEQILLQDPVLDLVSPVPHNLPASLTSFVGRDLEVFEVGEMLARTRLVTLTGAGGSGKTRLAVELGRRTLDEYPDGVWFVDSRGVEAVGVASVIASTLQMVTTGDRPVVDELVDALWSRRLLLVLDNCEHVLDVVAPLVDRLVGRDGDVRVLATSREALGVPGESMMLVRPLPMPESADADELASCEAAVLFADRARGVMPEFVVDEHVDAVFRVCRSVEGLPLALELAAARLRAFSPEELADRLGDQLATLRTVQRSGDLRHATIDATIQWSWDLLDDTERTLLSRLSVFHGTCSLEAAESVCGFEPVDGVQVADLVAGLVAKSLVVVDGVDGGSTRYRLLEPIRQYAAHQLDDQASDRLRHRLVDYWSATLAMSYDPDTRFAWRDHARARDLEVDQANLTAVIEWALASGRLEDAMKVFASPFGDLLILQGSGFRLAFRWINTAREHRKTIRDGVLLAALEISGAIAATVGTSEAMLDYAEMAIEIARTPEERHWFELAAALATSRLEGHSEKTKAMFDRVIAQADDPAMQASALLARTVFEVPQQAWTLVQQATELSPMDSLGYYDECAAGIRIADTAADSGHYDVAARTAERTLDLSRRFGSLVPECLAAVILARVYSIVGRIDEAATIISEVLPVAGRVLGPGGIDLNVVRRAGECARLQGDLDRARRYVNEVRATLKRNHLDAIGQMYAILTARESALISRDEGDLRHAEEELRDAFRRLEDLDHVGMGPWLYDMARAAQASIELRRGDPDRALAHTRAVFSEPRLHYSAVEAVDSAAIAFAQQGRAELAARLKGAVDSERNDCGLVIQPPDAPLRETAMRHAESLYGGDWDTAVEQGRAMTLQEAIELANTQANLGHEPRAAITNTDS